ncbi:GDYXXLXY domain-containing protein [Paralcaligenes ureilyticus]|uniref:Putative membrane-anchored protein n=1 Tax=Paralcaligenes ureilyticus TaxID=627131 RepID=A0A4V2UY28_9BURK|nr:GDYXXLXY domain-containing protein [Paralcaligenes ureilyticus]TCT05788.1 putative membrane-anchored protein [Paralcaligenes ureilyticus]
MQVQGHQKIQSFAPNWAEFFRKTAFSLGSLWLASAAICWVAANWPHATAFQKLAGAQACLAVIVLIAWLIERRSLKHKDQNFSVPAHLMGLGGVLVGALLALVGQIYQTGADAWELFAWWSVLVLPWLIVVRTVFLGLLWALILNAGVVLHAGLTGVAWFAGIDIYLQTCLSLAVLNGVLLWCWEWWIEQFDDRWRIGPRVLCATLLGWLIVAQLMYFDFPGSAGKYRLQWLILLGLGAAGVLYRIYTCRRRDPAMVSLAGLAAFMMVAIDVLTVLPYSVPGLSAMVVVLMVLGTLLLRRLRAQLAVKSPGDQPPSEGDVVREPWFIGAFRIVVMWVIAGLIIALLAIGLDLDMGQFALAGVVLCGAGLLILRARPAGAVHEAAAALAAAGLLLGSLGWYGSLSSGMLALVVLAMGIVVYSLGANSILRFFAAILVLWADLILTWPHWYRVLDLDMVGPLSTQWSTQAAYIPVYWRLFLLFAAALGAFYAAAQDRRRDIWSPLAWALALTAQGLACVTPFAGIGVALVWMIVGFALGRRSLLGFGVLGLLASLWRFYYFLDIGLADKAMWLAASGALSIGLWVLLRSRRPPARTAPSLARPPTWRQVGVLGGLLVVLLAVNGGIYLREQILRSGQRVVLALTPADPRSLIQGDYMALDFAVARPLLRLIDASDEGRQIRRAGGGYLVLQPDAQGVDQLQAVQLAAGRGKGILLEFRLRDAGVRIVTNAYFFPEGQRRRYEHAKYGEFRVAANGVGLLTHLLDADLKPL